MLDTYRDGDALGMVCGHGLDGLDWDTRHGGDVTRDGMLSAGVWPTTYGTAATPSGGGHDLVAALGVRSRDGISNGLDVKAGVDGAGCGFLFIAPTRKKSKVDGEIRAYQWTTRPDLDRLAEDGPTDDSGAHIAEMVGTARVGDAAPEDESPGEHDVEYADLTENQRARVDSYIESTRERIGKELRELQDWTPGQRDAKGNGWQKITADAAWRLGQLAREHWNTLTEAEARKVLVEKAPRDPGFDLPKIGKIWEAQWRRRPLEGLPPDLRERTTTEDEPAAGVDTTMSTDTAVTEPVSPWGKVDLAEVLADDYEPPRATILRRSDDIGLIYPGKAHSFIGESEVGKSWIALQAVAEQIALGERVLYLDYETDAAEITGRLRAMGVPKGDLLRYLDYRQPEMPPTANDTATLTGYALAVIDGVTACLSTFGFKGDSNDDVAIWTERLLKPVARNSAAVVSTDHVTKAKDTRGNYAIGAQSKRALADVCYLVSSDDPPFARGRTSVLRLEISKDRPGYVRGASPAGRAGERQIAARVVLDSDADTHQVTVKVEAPTLQQQIDAEQQMANELDRLGCPVFGRDKTIAWMKDNGMPTRSAAFMTRVVGIRNAKAQTTVLDDE
ncbi:AAA family ATPase [Nocardia sp. BSTN01]|uniref:AAA family ATPase n=1 Tax=Nocardia sp. BSTN01 TaxID=2783665 RepID=UPI00188ED2FB|nr:AAA family ATPase [Nocardia sp. BSTN01]MBF4998643.1 AAA family ATPase [Nocardia sp. BSTN01]